MHPDQAEIVLVVQLPSGLFGLVAFPEVVNMPQGISPVLLAQTTTTFAVMSRFLTADLFCCLFQCFKGLTVVTVITHLCDVPEKEEVIDYIECYCGSPVGHTFIVDDLMAGKQNGMRVRVFVSVRISNVNVYRRNSQRISMLPSPDCH